MFGVVVHRIQPLGASSETSARPLHDFFLFFLGIFGEFEVEVGTFVVVGAGFSAIVVALAIEGLVALDVSLSSGDIFSVRGFGPS